MILLAVLSLALLTASSYIQEPSPTSPAVPYENHGACPFECCTYRTWSVEEDTGVLSARTDDAPAAFAVYQGETVEGITGVVVTTRPGRAIVRNAIEIGTGEERVQVEPGDSVFILHYLGEGYWKFWVRGHTGHEEIPDNEYACHNAERERVPCSIQMEEEPETTWWARIRSRGREGWTRQLDHFGNKDACS